MNDQDFVGLDLQDAVECCQHHGIICRIVGEDDESYFVTSDLDMSRLNFVVENKKVVSVSRG